MIQKSCWRETHRKENSSTWLCLVALIASALQSSADTPLVGHGDSWRYSKGTNAVQVGWKTSADADLDATWLTGNGGFGFADNSSAVALVQTPLTDMQNRYTTVFMRRTFQIDSAVDPDLHLVLTMDWDDGFIAWLDSAYLTNINSFGAPAEPANTATASRESSRGNSSPNPPMSFDLGAIGSRFEFRRELRRR